MAEADAVAELSDAGSEDIVVLMAAAQGAKPASKRCKRTEADLRPLRFARITEEYDFIDSSPEWRKRYIELGQLFCVLCMLRLSVGRYTQNIKEHERSNGYVSGFHLCICLYGLFVFHVHFFLYMLPQQTYQK